MMVALFPASDHGPLHYRDLERFKIVALRKAGSWNKKTTLTPNCLAEMQWWGDYLSTVPCKSLLQVKYDTHLYSDSSGEGWVCLCKGAKVNGTFSEKQKLLSINTKELLAIYYGLQCLKDKLKESNILCMCDNTTAVSCILKKGARDRVRDKITKAIFELVWGMNSQITATHLAGSLNRDTDSLSRKDFHNERLEWSLPRDIYRDIILQLPFSPNIDFFASYLNNQCPVFCSYKCDPGALYVDAFTMCWKGWLPYTFPPFSLLDRTIAKIKADAVKNVALVVPIWPTAQFFGMLLRHMKGKPILLPLGTAKRLFLLWDMTKRCPVKKLKLALLHLSATC